MSRAAPQRNPRAEKAGKKILKFGCLPAFAIVILLIIVGSALDNGDDNAKAPAYKVVQQDTSGNTRNVTVEVATTKNLRAVFDAVTNDLDDEAGYWVVINCSTGGTKSVDNRLANGKYAVGRMGAAATGLDDGDSEFSTNKGRSCPSKD